LIDAAQLRDVTTGNIERFVSRAMDVLGNLFVLRDGRADAAWTWEVALIAGKGDGATGTLATTSATYRSTNDVEGEAATPDAVFAGGFRLPADFRRSNFNDGGAYDSVQIEAFVSPMTASAGNIRISRKVVWRRTDGSSLAVLDLPVTVAASGSSDLPVAVPMTLSWLREPKAGDFLHVTIYRDSGHANDTYPDSIIFSSVTAKIGRTLRTA